MSRADVARRYRAELRAESVPPPAFTISDKLPTTEELACSACGLVNAWLVSGSARRGTIKRFCGDCWPGDTA